MEKGMKLYLFPGYERFRRRVIEAADIAPDETILDFGCGVGLLEDFLLPELSAKGKVVGVDVGKELIETAASRFKSRTNCDFKLIEPSGRLPFEPQSFDLIITNLVLHLLTRSQKENVLREFVRVLKPGGRLILAEIGKPSGLFGYWMKFLTLSFWVRIWPYEINSVDSFEGRLPRMIREAGFERVEVVGRMRGYVDLIRCSA